MEQTKEHIREETMNILIAVAVALIELDGFESFTDREKVDIKRDVRDGFRGGIQELFPLDDPESVDILAMSVEVLENSARRLDIDLDRAMPPKKNDLDWS